MSVAESVGKSPSWRTCSSMAFEAVSCSANCDSTDLRRRRSQTGASKGEGREESDFFFGGSGG
jgi:hypothetical protein